MGFGNKKNYNEDVIPLLPFKGSEKSKKNSRKRRRETEKRKTFREGKIDITQ